MVTDSSAPDILLGVLDVWFSAVPLGTQEFVELNHGVQTGNEAANTARRVSVMKDSSL